MTTYRVTVTHTPTGNTVVEEVEASCAEDAAYYAMVQRFHASGHRWRSLEVRPGDVREVVKEDVA